MKHDARVEKTLEAIRGTFEAMLLEMPYSKITVKELCARARINKKTFYHYYPKLSALLDELEHSYVDPFVALTKDMRYPDDANKITVEFLRYSAKQGKLYDAIFVSNAHAAIRMHMVSGMEKDRYIHSVPPEGWTKEEWNIYMISVTSMQLQIYRQWVQDGRAVPVDRLIQIAGNLIFDGIVENSQSD